MPKESSEYLAIELRISMTLGTILTLSKMIPVSVMVWSLAPFCPDACRFIQLLCWFEQLQVFSPHPPNRICFSLRVQLLEMVLEEDWKKPRFAQPNFGDAIFGLSWLRISDFHWNHQILWLSALLLFWEASHIRYMNLFIYIYYKYIYIYLYMCFFLFMHVTSFSVFIFFLISIFMGIEILIYTK